MKGSPSPAWHVLTRIAFRFTFVYFGLYSLTSNILTSIFVLPSSSPGPGLGTLWPLREATSWTAVHMLGMTGPLLYAGNSRDTNFFWAQLFLILLIAIGATALWSFLDRRSENDVSLHKWFRVFIRFGLAAQMIYFGMLKVIPTQFPAPSLVTLVAPVGNLSLQGFLWSSIGASQPYQIFTGIVEVLGGLLLIAPRTTMLGAAICLATMLQIFVLNMTYDVGVKILSFQLASMSVFLLAPDLQRLMNVFILNRPTAPSTHVDLFRTLRANRIAFAVQIAFGLYLLGVYANIGRILWYTDGGGSPKSLLYGIWNVEELSVDGEVRPAELNDYDRRWRRVIFDAPQWIFFQRTDDSFARYGVSIDSEQRAFSLTKGHSRSWHSNFTFERPDPDRLLLNGEMDGHKINAKLQLVQFDTFRLLNSRFRWIRPPDAE
jgi:hypothetical protein